MNHSDTGLTESDFLKWYGTILLFMQTKECRF